MKKSRTVIATALALGLASTAALAASGDRWHGTYRGDSYVVTNPDVTYVERDPRDVIVYQERYVSAPRTAILVDGRYVYADSNDVYYLVRDPRANIPTDPNTGQLIDHGLFNREGPNDFGQ